MSKTKEELKAQALKILKVGPTYYIDLAQGYLDFVQMWDEQMKHTENHLYEFKKENPERATNNPDKFDVGDT